MGVEYGYWMKRWMQASTLLFATRRWFRSHTCSTKFNSRGEMTLSCFVWGSNHFQCFSSSLPKRKPSTVLLAGGCCWCMFWTFIKDFVALKIDGFIKTDLFISCYRILTPRSVICSILFRLSRAEKGIRSAKCSAQHTQWWIVARFLDWKFSEGW